jgi:hypothetical protein
MAKKDSIKMLKAKIAVLQQAKKRFNTGGYPGICSAITFSYDYCDSEQEKAAKELKNYISKQLQDYLYLNGWLRNNRPKVSTSEFSMKKHRLQWIDWMIACLQEDLASKLSKTQR